MDRLRALDTEFLHLEDGISHMHLGGMSVFDGPPPSDEAILDLLKSKLALVPRYRQRARSVPFELGRPVWVDDPHFHLDQHVRSTALDEPADDAAVCRLMGRIMSQELDRDRPLWQVRIVRGLPHDRWALVSKVHHCMVDGLAGVGLLEALLDVDPDPVLLEAAPWTPTTEPSGAALTFDAWAGLLSDVAGRTRQLPVRLAHPVRMLQSFCETGLGLVRLGRRSISTQPFDAAGSIGPDRSWAHSLVSFDDVRLIRKSLGGTVNDVVLAAVTNGHRELLLAHGADLETAQLRTLVPVSVRGDGEADAGNRVSAVLCDLPVGLADPVERLTAVHAQMAELKASHMPEAGSAVVSFAELVPPMLVGNTTRVLMRVLRSHPLRSVATVTTNVPGPQFPLYCLGREMLEHRPYVPISHGLRVGTAVLSYNGWLCFGVTGDAETTPDIDIVARGITAGIDELVAASR